MIGVPTQCPAEGFFTKKGLPRTVARTVENFCPEQGGVGRLRAMGHFALAGLHSPSASLAVLVLGGREGGAADIVV